MISAPSKQDRIDDQGRRLTRVASLTELTNATGMSTAKLTAAAHKAIPKEHRRRAVGLALGGLCLLIVIVIISYSGAVTPAQAAFVLAAIWAGLVILIARDVQRGEYTGLKNVLKLRRICFGCGYRLDGLARENDACVVCPECGAAWRLDERTDVDD